MSPTFLSTESTFPCHVTPPQSLCCLSRPCGRTRVCQDDELAQTVMLSAGDALPGAWASWVSSSVADLEARNLLRSLRPVVPTESPVEVVVPLETFDAWLAGRASVGECVKGLQAGEAPLGVRVRLFSTNDYLGLSTHAAVRAASARAAAQLGSGPRASALVAGYTLAHRQLESALAHLKRTQECLLFPTGFAANASVIQARTVHARSRAAPLIVARSPGAGWRLLLRRLQRCTEPCLHRGRLPSGGARRRHGAHVPSPRLRAPGRAAAGQPRCAQSGGDGQFVLHGRPLGAPD